MRWLKHVLLRGRRNDDLAVSIREHLEEKIDELMNEGLSREEAERAARRDFGNVTLVEERSREMWQWPTIESIWADVRFAVRQLIKSPVFTTTAVTTLALGIAVNATMFSMDGVIETQRNGNPLFTRMMATFAFLALTLASVGIYGLIAYSVSQRTQEIGIRMALGARESDISWMILREGLRIAVIGLIMALPLPKVFDSIFTGIPMGAPEIYPMVLAAMLFVAMLATFVPARKAVKVDPSVALRSE